MDNYLTEKKGFSRFVNWYFGRRALPYWTVLAFDCFIVLGSLLLAHVLNNGLQETFDNFVPLVLDLVVSLLCYILSFKVFHTYNGILRYSSFMDLARIGYSILLGSSINFLVHLIFRGNSGYLGILTMDLLIGSVIAVLLMWLSRVIVKIAFDTNYARDGVSNVLIFGTREGGVAIAKSMRNQHPTKFNVCGFITNLPDMIGHTLLDRPIFGTEDPKLWKFIEKEHIKYVYVSPLAQEYFVNNCQDMISRFLSIGVKLWFLPVEQEWDGKSQINHWNLREVKVEDLLPRKKIEIDLEAIAGMLSGKRIMITGAAGSIGSEIVRQLASFAPAELLLVDQAETPMHDMRLEMARKFPGLKVYTIVASITNEEYMKELFETHKPEYVFHAAAYKHVPMMEDNPAMAVQNNVRGTKIIADLSVANGVQKFVMVSTDKAVNPANVMGCSKRICEIYCQSLNAKVAAEGGVTQFVTTRFGNVLGSNGSVIPIFEEQIRHGGPVTVTDANIVRYFMLIPEACKLVLEAGALGKGGEIFVFDMGSPVRIADLAQRMINLMGANGVEIKYTGLRDGEKLYEEVLSLEENTKPTVHPKIKVASVREYPYDEALRNEYELYELSRTGDRMAIVAKMKEIVPEFKSCNSVYDKLDK